MGDNMSYTSILNPGELVIDDSVNQLDLRDPIVGGIQRYCTFHRDYNVDPFGSFATPFTLPIIPRDEWTDRIEEMEKTKSRLSDLMKGRGIRTKDQARTSFCWVFAATSAVQAVRVVQGYEHLELSPASVGCLVTNYRNVGGWSTEAVRAGAKYGWAPSDLWPDIGISRQYNTQEVKEKRIENKVQEWWELRPRSEEELMTCLLSRIPVAVGFSWWRHAVLACDPLVFGKNDFGHRDLNSWGPSYGEEGWFVLKGSRSIADDQVAPRSSA